MILLGSFYSCSVTYSLKEDEYLLKDEMRIVRVEKEKADSSKEWKLVEKGAPNLKYSRVRNATKIRPNKRMLKPKSYLHLYNLGHYIKREDFRAKSLYYLVFPDGGLPDTLSNLLIETIGEEPVLIDTLAIQKDVKNLKSTLFANGFFNADVSYKIDTLTRKRDKQKANITLMIEEKEAYFIDTILFRIKDPTVAKFLNEDYKEGRLLLKHGDLYTESNLAKERSRFANDMRVRGYFKFKPGMISYEVDTSLAKTHHIPANQSIENYRGISVTYIVEEVPEIYTIRNITMMVEPSDIQWDDIPLVVRADELTEKDRKELGIPHRVMEDTLHATFKVYDRVLDRVNMNLLMRRIHIHPGHYYSIRNDQRTQSGLQEYGIFKYSIVKYQIVDTANGNFS